MSKMFGNMKVRPQVFAIICILGMGLGMSILSDAWEVATGIVVAMGSFATKLIEQD